MRRRCGKILIRPHASARRFSLERRVRACAPRAAWREADPRPARRRRGGRRLEPEAEVASGDRRQPARRDQPDETHPRVAGLDRAAGGDSGPRAAGCDRVGRRRLRSSSGIDRDRRRARPARGDPCGLVRLAPIVSRGGSQFLGAQRAWRSAGIRFVPRGDPSSHGTRFRSRAAERRSHGCGP